MVDHTHSIFRETTPEPGEGGMIGSGIFEGKPQELLEGVSVVDLCFQLRIGVDLEPLLEEKAFHKEEGRIGIISFEAFTDGIIFHEQAFNSGPVDGSVNLFHSFDGTILFHGSKERYIGESEVGIHLFKSHDDSSEVVYLKESYVKTETLSSNIYNNINTLSLHNCEFITDN